MYSLQDQKIAETSVNFHCNPDKILMVNYNHFQNREYYIVFFEKEGNTLMTEIEIKKGVVETPKEDIYNNSVTF